MTVVAPVTAVTSAAIPVDRRTGRAASVRLASADRRRLRPGSPSPWSAWPRRGRASGSWSPRPLVGWSVLSGVGFAMFFVFIARAGNARHRSARTLAGRRVPARRALASVVCCSCRPATRRLAARRSLDWTLLAGPMDMTANMLYLLASRTGDLSIVAPLASLYPVTTVILAMIIDHERVRSVQVVGLVLAVAALLLVAR